MTPGGRPPASELNCDPRPLDRTGRLEYLVCYCRRIAKYSAHLLSQWVLQRTPKRDPQRNSYQISERESNWRQLLLKFIVLRPASSDRKRTTTIQEQLLLERLPNLIRYCVSLRVWVCVCVCVCVCGRVRWSCRCSGGTSPTRLQMNVIRQVLKLTEQWCEDRLNE